MSSLLAPRSVLLIVVALVAAIGCWFVFDRGAAPKVAPVGNTSVESASASATATPVALAEVAGAVDPIADDRARSAVGSALIGATWGELLVAVDRGTRQPIAGATIALVDTDGERREVLPSDAVLASDLADGALVALSASMHLTRVFFAHHLRDHSGPPRSVSLHPTAAVRVRLVDELSALAAPLCLQVFTIEQLWSKEVVWGDEVDAETNEPARLGRRDANTLRNLRFIASAESDAHERKRQLRWLSRSEDVHPLLTPDGPPKLAAWDTTQFQASDPWPREVDALPVGFDVVVKVAVENVERPEDQFSKGRPGFEFRIEGSDEWSGFEQSTLITTIDPGVVTEIEVRGSAPASVRGLLPIGARSGRVRVVANIGGTIVSEGGTEVGTDGAFRITDLKPGPSVIAAQWNSSDADIGFLELPVDLEPGREFDLGRLAIRADGRTLTLSSNVLVDGLPANAEVVALLQSAQLTLDWMSEESWDDPESLVIQHDEISVPLGATVTLSGLAPTLGRLSMRADAQSVGERLEGRLLLERIFKNEAVDLALADQTLELFVQLERVTSCSGTFTLPAGMGHGHVSLEVHAFALERNSRLEFPIGDAESLSTAERHTRMSSLSLPRGEWLVVAVARPADWRTGSESSESTYAESFIGTARVTVGDAPPAALAIELGPAASLRVAVPAGGGASTSPLLTLHPVGLPRLLANLSMLRVPAPGTSEILHGLLPDTEYVDRMGALVVRTGGPGSVTELVLP